MKKKFLLLSFLSLVLFVTAIAFANDVSLTLTSFVTFPKMTVTHEDIKTISPETRILKPKISVDFANYISATARVEYYIDGNNSNILYAPDEELTIYNKKEFFITLPKLDESNSYLDYRIRVIVKNDEGTVDTLYYPEKTKSGDDVYITAVVTSSSTATVTESEGGTVVYDDGDQESGSSSVTFDPGSVDGSGEITIEEFSFDDFFSSFFPVSAFTRSAAVKVAKSIAKADISKDKFVKGYKVSSTGDLTINTYGHAEFSYGSETTATKFDLVFSPISDGTMFEYIPITKVDTEKRVVSCELKDFGYYIIMLNSNLGDNDYRPAKRVRIKSRIASGKYEGFRFGNLSDGDVVKIYDLSGKKVAELTNGFVWTGRKGTDNSGDWAESGTYIYQIKLKEKGKIISGTIAFVW